MAAFVAYSKPWTWDLPWYSRVAGILVVPFILTFFVYAPVLFLRQVIRSGSRGCFVLRTFLSIVAVAGLLLGGMLLSGDYNPDKARLVAGVFTAGAIVYLNWRLETKRDR